MGYSRAQRYRPCAALYGGRGSLTLSTRRPRLAGAYGLYYLDGRPLLLRAGHLPYWRLEPDTWATAAGALRDAGCNAVASDVPWAWHAPSPEGADLTGETHPGRDVVRLLGLARDAGLVAVLHAGPALRRQGPPVPGSVGGGDLPSWLPERIPAALARGPDGTPARENGAPVVSPLHPDFLEQAGRWLDRLGAVLAPSAGDPVVAWRLDGGAGGQLGAGRWAPDFNPHTVDRYRRFLAGRYESVRLLAREWRKDVDGFDAVLPPRDRRSAGELADWQAFLEEASADYLRRLGALARAAGAGVPLLGAVQAGGASPETPAVVAPALDLFAFGASPAPGAPIRHGGGTAAPIGAGPAALRHEPYAADERPLTAWGLSGVADLLSAVAHGIKGVTVDLPRSAEAAEGVGALLRWLGTAEEELTASVELRDPIAYLDYPDYARVTPDDLRAPDGDPLAERFGLLALLLIAGYNPTVVDLATVADAELTDFPAAVFPSRGYLRTTDYGKLVVFTLRGGALLTFPEPATRETDGTPLNTRFLWPHGAAAPSLAGVLRRLVARGPLRPALREVATGATLRPTGPLHLFPHAGQPFVRYGRAGPGPGGAGGVPRAATESVRAQVLLTAGSAPAAYRVQVRSGTSTVLGTPPPAPVVTPREAPRVREERHAWRDLVVRLFGDVAPRNIVPDATLEVEAVVRLSPDGGCLLFVVNRGGHQAGSLRFPTPGALDLGAEVRAEVLFSAGGTRVDWSADALRLDLAPGDALVVRLR